MQNVVPDRFEDRAEFKLAGVRESFHVANAPHHIGEIWAKLNQLAPLPGQTADAAYGVWCSMDKSKGLGEYMAGAEVSGFDGLPADVGRMIVPAARYAVFKHDGPVAEAGGVWQGIFGAWLPNSGFVDGGTPPFERYGPDFDVAGKSGGMEIWLPVKAAE